MTHKVQDLLGWRVLVTIGDNDAIRETCIRGISPNGRYVHLASDGASAEWIGWHKVEDVSILDAIAPNDGRIVMVTPKPEKQGHERNTRNLLRSLW